MSTLLKIIFLYLPAAFAYYTFIVTFLLLMGYIEHPQANNFNPDDYQEIYSETLESGTKVTYHEIK